MNKKYLCIDLKSFYASVECVERDLDPLTTNLVVADAGRTEKTICLAVTPSLKAYGLSGRARLFEVVQCIREVNSSRSRKSPKRKLTGQSFDANELSQNPSLAVSYITAPPRMAYYIEYSARIFEIYLKYIAKEDILNYSIDEVFMDVTNYTHRISAYELAKNIIKDISDTMGITATAGIGSNMYLAKIAMDIVAKRIEPDRDGVRIAALDEMSYRRELWNHKPITDFWRIGGGTARRLESNGMYTMGDVARRSLALDGEKHLFKLFGKNAELVIDHAWGREPVTMQDIKAYKPDNRCLGSGQVLHCPYDFKKARIIVKEMLELLALDLVEKRLVTDQIVLTIGYDISNLTNTYSSYHGEVTTDYYGRRVPKHAHGTANIGRFTSSAILIIKSALELFDRIVNPELLVRRVNISANHIVSEEDAKDSFEQMSMFTDYEHVGKTDAMLAKERKLQETTIELRKRFGKNTILKGINLTEGATTMERNRQIGGHKA